jgi:capsule polysaccharide modification protein KpsS
VRHAVAMSQTSQTLALVGATLGAVVITFIGTSYQQHVQARWAARDAQNRMISELLSAAMDVLYGIRAIREGCEIRNFPGTT